jgi:hypothetical protein
LGGTNLDFGQRTRSALTALIWRLNRRDETVAASSSEGLGHSNCLLQSLQKIPEMGKTHAHHFYHAYTLLYSRSLYDPAGASAQRIHNIRETKSS